MGKDLGDIEALRTQQRRAGCAIYVVLVDDQDALGSKALCVVSARHVATITRGRFAGIGELAARLLPIPASPRTTSA